MLISRLRGSTTAYRWTSSLVAAASSTPSTTWLHLAKSGVKILHIHGDQDQLVPMSSNSTELARRCRELGGDAEIVVLHGLGHGGQELYTSEPLLKFLLGD